MNTMRAVVTLMAVAVSMGGCAAGGGGGGAGTGGYPGGPVGHPCAVEGQVGCTFADGHASGVVCSGNLWAEQIACAPGTFCSIGNSGKAQCGSQVGAGGDEDTASQSSADGGSTSDSSSGGGGGTGPDAAADTSKPDLQVGPKGLTAQGSFTASIDGGSFTVDYTGLPVQAAMVHRQTSAPAGTACISSLVLSVAKPDGSCRLDIAMSAGFEGEGLRIDLIQFFAKVAVKQGNTVISTLPCEGWTQEPSTGEVIYQSVGALGGMILPPLSQPAAGQAIAELKNQQLAVGLDAPVNMKFAGRKFNLDLSAMSFAGDFTSNGDPNAACAKQAFAMPKWSLQDVNPGSPGYKNTYGLDAFKGKKIVVALVSDWCNSCRAQSQLMQKLQDQAIASGHSDVQMVLIADKQKSDMTQLTKLIKDIPLFSDTAAVDAWSKMNAAHAGTLKASQIRNSGYGYAKNGKEIMYFAPNGTGSLNLTAFQQAVMTVVNAPD